MSVISWARVRSWSCSTTSVMSPSSRARCAREPLLLAEQGHAHGGVDRDGARDPDHLPAGHETDAHVRIEELRPVGGDRDVTGGDQVEAGTTADPVDRDHDRLGHRTERRRRFLGRLPFPEVREVPPLVRHLAVGGDAFDVGAGTERPTVGGDEDRPHVVVGFGAGVGVAQLALHVEAHRVEHLRPVERDRRGAIGDLVEDGVVAHRTRYPPSTTISWPVMYAASSLARNRIALAMSSTVPARRIGTSAPESLDPRLLLFRAQAEPLARRHRCAHVAGRHRVDPHAVAGELGADVAAVAQDRALGRGVGRTADAHRRRDRRHVHDRPAPRVDEGRDRRPGAHVHALQVGLDDAVPGVLGGVPGVARIALGDPRVVDQDVDPHRSGRGSRPRPARRRPTSRCHRRPPRPASRRPPRAGRSPGRPPRRARRSRPVAPSAPKRTAVARPKPEPPPVTIAVLPSSLIRAPGCEGRSRRDQDAWSCASSR